MWHHQWHRRRVNFDIFFMRIFNFNFGNVFILFYCIIFVYRAKDGIKAIKKRLANKKDFKSIMYTLTVSTMNIQDQCLFCLNYFFYTYLVAVVKLWCSHMIFQLLESCVKNCGHRFHVLIANKDVLEDLTKILGPKVAFLSLSFKEAAQFGFYSMIMLPQSNLMVAII